jgi:hypothetical protein
MEKVVSKDEEAKLVSIIYQIETERHWLSISQVDYFIPQLTVKILCMYSFGMLIAVIPFQTLVSHSLLPYDKFPSIFYVFFVCLFCFLFLSSLLFLFIDAITSTGCREC